MNHVHIIMKPKFCITEKLRPSLCREHTLEYDNFIVGLVVIRWVYGGDSN